MTGAERRRVLREQSPTGAVNYEYDAVSGERVRRFTGTSGTYAGDLADPKNDTQYKYDSLGRLTRVLVVERNNAQIDVDPVENGAQPEETTYYYDLPGNLDRTDSPGGVITDYEYDEFNRLEALTHFEADGTPDDLSDNETIARFEYQLRADGKREQATETTYFDLVGDDGIRETEKVSIYNWVYDNLGRLTSETIDHFDDTLDQTETFVYDLASNRKGRTIDKAVDQVFASQFDANDRLISETIDDDGDGTDDRVVTYGYNGTEQTSKLSETITSHDPYETATTGEVTYAYNLQGRLKEVETKEYTDGAVSSKTRLTYEYDPQGMRIRAVEEVDADGEGEGSYQTVSETEYLIDPHNETGYAQTIVETTVTPGTGTTKKIYTFGHDEITQTTYTYDTDDTLTSEITHTFAHDGHGSVRVLLEAAAAIAQIYTYSAYGELLAIHNAQGEKTATNAADALTTLLYSGETFDPQTGLQYLRARYYDPNTGRFNRFDPFGGDIYDPLSLHRYLYTHANPIMGVDPLGLFLGVPVTLQRYGLSMKQAGLVMSAWDRLDTAISVGQVVIQVAVTGTVNPMDLAELAFELLPGSKMLKRISVTVLKPFGKCTRFAGKLTGSSDFLTRMARNVDEVGKNMYKNVSGNWAKPLAVQNRFIERIGEMGGGLVAKKLGLKHCDDFVKKGVHGFDGVFKKGNQFFILEAKGRASTLAKTQMSQKWIVDRIRKLDEPLRSQLNRARKNGELFGIVTTTPIDEAAGAILDPEYTVKAFDLIGSRAW